MSADTPMEPAEPQGEPTEPQSVPPPTESTEPPQTTEPTPPAEPPVPTPPKRKQRRPRVTVATADSQPQEVPSREPKRPNRRTQTPPSIVVDQNFWSGLLATQRALKREAKVQRFSNLSIV